MRNKTYACAPGLQRWIEANGVVVVWLCNKLGISRNAFYNITSGKTRPENCKYSVIARLIDITGMTFEDLFGYDIDCLVC